MAFVLVLFIGTVHAADDISVTALKAGYIRAGENALGQTQWVKRVDFNASYWQQMQDKAQRVSKYHSKQGPLSSGTIGSLGRKALRGGVYGVVTQLALEQVIDGAGWAFNELQNQVQNPGVPSEELTGGQYWCATSGLGGFELSGTYCTSTAQAMANFLVGKTIIGNGANEMGKVVTQATLWGSNVLARSYVGSTLVASVTVAMRTTLITPYSTPGSQAPTPISDVDLGERIRQNPDLVNDLLTDPRTGVPVSTPEMQQMIDELKEEIRNREGFDPQTPTPTPDLDDDTETPNEGTEWPSFCSWATVVCDFIDWYKGDGDDDVDLPETELDVQASNWSSGIGGGSCPVADSITVSVLGTSGDITFDWQPLCSGATKLRPFLIAVCLMVAAFIIAGLRKSAV